MSTAVLLVMTLAIPVAGAVGIGLTSRRPNLRETVTLAILRNGKWLKKKIELTPWASPVSFKACKGRTVARFARASDSRA